MYNTFSISHSPLLFFIVFTLYWKPLGSTLKSDLKSIVCTLPSKVVAVQHRLWQRTYLIHPEGKCNLEGSCCCWWRWGPFTGSREKRFGGGSHGRMGCGKVCWSKHKGLPQSELRPAVEKFTVVFIRPRSRASVQAFCTTGSAHVSAPIWLA